MISAYAECNLIFWPISFSKHTVYKELGGIKEAIENQGGEPLVAFRDPQALSQTIFTLIDIPDYDRKIDRNDRKKIEGAVFLRIDNQRKT